MTTQSHTYKPGDLMQIPATFTEEQLQRADLARLREQKADPYRERQSWRQTQLENQRRQQEGHPS
jgi:hypothetical protein